MKTSFCFLSGLVVDMLLWCFSTVIWLYLLENVHSFFFLTDFQEKQKLWIEMLPLYKCLNSFFLCVFCFCFVFTREPNVLRPFSPFFFYFSSICQKRQIIDFPTETSGNIVGNGENNLPFHFKFFFTYFIILTNHFFCSGRKINRTFWKQLTHSLVDIQSLNNHLH